MNYLLHVATTACIYLLLAQSLNLVAGYGGLMSLSHAAFFGIGAYGTAIGLLAGWPFLAAVSLGLAASALVAAASSCVFLRLRGDAFVLGTLALQVIFSAVFYNWTDVTGGPFGLAGIPRPAIGALTLRQPAHFFLLALAVSVAATMLYWWVGRLAYGRSLQAVREDEMVAVSLGKPAAFFRGRAFVLGASGASLAGALYGTYVGFVDSTSFIFDQSVLMLTAVVVGGAGNIRGPIAGALFVVLLPEMLRMVRVPDEVASHLRQVTYGVLLMIAMRYRPQGLAGRYAFDR